MTGAATVESGALVDMEPVVPESFEVQAANIARAAKTRILFIIVFYLMIKKSLQKRGESLQSVKD
jgi:hypothetical protein